LILSFIEYGRFIFIKIGKMAKSFRSSKMLIMLIVMIELFELTMIAKGMEIIKIENAGRGIRRF
jgi:hypothetical protein